MSNKKANANSGMHNYDLKVLSTQIQYMHHYLVAVLTILAGEEKTMEIAKGIDNLMKSEREKAKKNP